MCLMYREIMTKQSLTHFLIFCICCIAAGCDSGSQTTQYQDVAEVKWQSDGSAIFGFIQSYALNINSSQPSVFYNIAKFNTDGSVNQIYNSNGPASRPVDALGQTESYSPSIYLSADGSTIITQLEYDLYKYSVRTNVLQKIDSLFHLILVSPDLHYAIGTTSPQIQPTKTILVFDINSSPIRQVRKFDVMGVSLSPGIWLNNGSFGITCSDSVGEHISIFDTNSVGIPIAVIPGAQTQFHNAVFNAATNDLFIRDHAGKTTDYYLDKVNITSMARTTILNFQVDNFDVTNDEQVVIYAAKDTINSTTNGSSIKSRNLQTLNEQTLAKDNLRYVVLSPAQNQLAYVSGSPTTFNEIHVIPFTKP